VVQVQRWLGHHSPAFTLATYVDLLDSGVGEALDLSVELGQGGSQVATHATGIDRPGRSLRWWKSPISGGPVVALGADKG
jgi:hypothetical protein